LFKENQDSADQRSIKLWNLKKKAFLVVHPQQKRGFEFSSVQSQNKSGKSDELIYPLASSLNAPVLRCANLFPHRQFLTHAVALICWELNDAIKGRMCNSVIPIMRTVINAARDAMVTLGSALRRRCDEVGVAVTS
jgi:hypothetical protein